jgi:hypothetical protein
MEGVMFESQFESQEDNKKLVRVEVSENTLKCLIYAAEIGLSEMHETNDSMHNIRCVIVAIERAERSVRYYRRKAERELPTVESKAA